MTEDELFDALKSTSGDDRQKIIDSAIENGFDIETLREMLDYLENLP